MITREEALELLKQHIKNENLLKHCYAVEAGMRACARKFGDPSTSSGQEMEEVWALAGLLHDIDYEEHPDEHPSHRIREWLSQYDIPEEVIYAISAHGNEPDAPKRISKMDKALHAVDSVSGIIIAAALVRPEKLTDLTPKSVKKKIKDKSFAAKMDRERMVLGCEELGVEMSDHLQTVITGLQEIREELGL